MKLSEMGEVGLIRWLREELKGSQRRAIVGMGDDAAAIEISLERLLLLTTDSLVEDVHFKWKYLSPYYVGWKALAVNISDIAAMGGRPTYCVVSLCLSPDENVSLIRDLYRGLMEVASLHNVGIIGGNITRSSTFVITIALLGEIKRENILLRSGAKIGDLIYVTGELGTSEAGLVCLDRANLKLSREVRQFLINKHLMPSVRLKEGQKIAQEKVATAMIDLSDGLASDLFRLAEESKVGAVIYEEKIPISRFVKDLARELGKSPLEWALYGGEDYELLFTIPPDKKKVVEKLDFPSTLIGEVVDRREGVSLMKTCDKRIKLKDKGYNHLSRCII